MQSEYCQEDSHEFWNRLNVIKPEMRNSPRTAWIDQVTLTLSSLYRMVTKSEDQSNWNRLELFCERSVGKCKLIRKYCVSYDQIDLHKVVVLM